MKADPSELNALLDVQAQDSLIAQLKHRRDNLPELTILAGLQRARAEFEGTRVAAETESSDLEVEQRRADAEVEQVKTRRSRDEERLNSGAITNPKDLESLQHEMTALGRRVSALEDIELEVMQQLEDAEQRLAKVTAALSDLDAEIGQNEASRDAVFAELDADLTAAAADRAGAASRVSAELMELYERLRQSKDNIGAAALRQRACQGCRLEINGADLRELAAQPADEVLRCPECGRILVRTAESGL